MEPLFLGASPVSLHPMKMSFERLVPFEMLKMYLTINLVSSNCSFRTDLVKFEHMQDICGSIFKISKLTRFKTSDKST